jgi:hypothetical protein
MKKFIFFLAFLFSVSICFSQDIASCCTSKDDGRCTGSASCTACKNCSRCAHCGAGGTCGVCAPATERDRPKPSGNKPKSTGTGTKTPATTTNDDDVSAPAQFEVTAEVNLRSGPGENFGIIEKMKKGAKVIKLAERGTWTKVETLNTLKIGWVLSKSIR